MLLLALFSPEPHHAYRRWVRMSVQGQISHIAALPLYVQLSLKIRHSVARVTPRRSSVTWLQKFPEDGTCGMIAALHKSAFGGKADMPHCAADVCF